MRRCDVGPKVVYSVYKGVPLGTSFCSDYWQGSLALGTQGSIYQGSGRLAIVVSGSVRLHAAPVKDL